MLTPSNPSADSQVSSFCVVLLLLSIPHIVTFEIALCIISNTNRFVYYCSSSLSLSLSLTPHNHQFAIYPHPLNEANVIKSTIRNKARVISRDQDYYYFSSSEFSNTADWIDGQIYFFLNLIIGSSLATLYTDSNLSRSKQ